MLDYDFLLKNDFHFTVNRISWVNRDSVGFATSCMVPCGHPFSQVLHSFIHGMEVYCEQRQLLALEALAARTPCTRAPFAVQVLGQVAHVCPCPMGFNEHQRWRETAHRCWSCSWWGMRGQMGTKNCPSCGNTNYFQQPELCWVLDRRWQ